MLIKLSLEALITTCIWQQPNIVEFGSFVLHFICRGALPEKLGVFLILEGEHKLRIFKESRKCSGE